jgi:putative phosphoribosyl transferase
MLPQYICGTSGGRFEKTSWAGPDDGKECHRLKKRGIAYHQQPLLRDRTEAGQRLAELLSNYQGEDVIVLAILRGGIPVAVQVADRLGADLGVVIPRKIPIPNEPEAGYGAVAEDGTIVLNGPLVRQLGISESQIERQAAEVHREIVRRSEVFRQKMPVVSVQNRIVIIIDDGLASGFTMIAAAKSVLKRGAAQVAVAVPVASETAYDLVKPMVNDLVCLAIGQGAYFAVASFYLHWHDLTDEEVLEYLDGWRANRQRYVERSSSQT